MSFDPTATDGPRDPHSDISRSASDARPATGDAPSFAGPDAEQPLHPNAEPTSASDEADAQTGAALGQPAMGDAVAVLAAGGTPASPDTSTQADAIAPEVAPELAPDAAPDPAHATDDGEMQPETHGASWAQSSPALPQQSEMRGVQSLPDNGPQGIEQMPEAPDAKVEYEPTEYEPAEYEPAEAATPRVAWDEPPSHDAPQDLREPSTSDDYAATPHGAPAPEPDNSQPPIAEAYSPLTSQPPAIFGAAPSYESPAAPTMEPAMGYPGDPGYSGWPSPPSQAEPSVQPTWAQQVTQAEPPGWSQQPSYASPSYAPPAGLPTDAAPAPQAAPAFPSAYAPPYLPSAPVAAPSDQVYVSAHPATMDAPPVYAPTAPPLPRSRWPLVLMSLAVVAVLAAVVLAVMSSGFVGLIGGARSGSPTLYQNPMTSVVGDWPNDPECRFGSDGYHITNASNCYYSGADYRDVTVTVTAKLLKGDPTGTYGIAFRRPSPNNFYVFLVTGTGDWLVVKNDIPLQSATHNSAIKSGVGAVNKLAVRMQGAHFTFFVNGVQLGDLSDSTYSSGKVGVAGDTNIEVVFRDFSVTQP